MQQSYVTAMVREEEKNEKKTLDDKADVEDETSQKAPVTEQGDNRLTYGTSQQTTGQGIATNSKEMESNKLTPSLSTRCSIS